MAEHDKNVSPSWLKVDKKTHQQKLLSLKRRVPKFETQRILGRNQESQTLYTSAHFILITKSAHS